MDLPTLLAEVSLVAGVVVLVLATATRRRRWRTVGYALLAWPVIGFLLLLLVLAIFRGGSTD
jgi:hypothetical protein